MLAVGARYFDALGVSFLRGRTFELSEGTPGREVVVINQRLASRYFGNADPVGQRIRLNEDNPNAPQYAWATIVGVTPNIRQRTGGQGDPEPDPVVYIPHSQNTGIVGLGNVLVRARGNPAEVMPVVRKEIFALDPDLSLANMRTLDESLAQQRWFPRVFGIMFTVFAGIAIVLAAVGLVRGDGVFRDAAHSGDRHPHGARRAGQAGVVADSSARAHSTGYRARRWGWRGRSAPDGCCRACCFRPDRPIRSRWCRSRMLLIVVAVTACLWPAWQATRLNPVTALRYE